MTDYNFYGNNIIEPSLIQQIDDSEQDWVDFIAKGAIIYDRHGSVYCGFQRMKDGRYCFFGRDKYGNNIYKVL